LTDRWGLSFN